MRTHTPDEVLPPVGDEATSVCVPQKATGAGVASAEGRNIAMPLEEGMCLSYWLQGVRNNPLLDHRTTATLPTAADVVIIGSGVSVSTARRISPGRYVALFVHYVRIPVSSSSIVYVPIPVSSPSLVSS
jgi:hypothetical protein